MSDAAADRLLVLFDEADAVRDIFDARVPADVPVRYVERAADLPAVLDAFRPTVAFGVPGEGIGKQALKRALDFESVRWFSNGGAGVEHLMPWDPAEKTVTNAAGVNAAFLAEYVASAVQMMNVGFVGFMADTRARRWRERTWTGLAGKRACVVGLGHVGRAVAERLTGLGLEVVGVRANPRPTDHVSQVYGADRVAEAVTDCDFVCVHAALTEGSRGLVDAAVFDAMKPGVHFLNAARGPVVDEDALIDALGADGRIASAVLDVFTTEPLPESSPIWDFDQVVVTPHIADLVDDWYRRMAIAFCDNLARAAAGEVPTNVVDPARGY